MMEFEAYAVEFDYVNYRGEASVRTVRPERLYWGATSHHPVPQWILHAYDCDKLGWRDFAMNNVKNWRPKST